MSESSPEAEPTQDRAVLLQQNGELSEFAAMLNDLAVPIDERAGPLPDAEELQNASVVIVTGTRLLEGNTPNLDLWPRTIAVIDGTSKTLAAHLSRIGIAMLIRRPIHPRALRLLLLHELYRGPERRVRKRVLIGHPVRMGTGLFKQRATLLELSPGGARLEVANPPKVGSTIRILVGKELTRAKPAKLKAKVVRSIRRPGENGAETGEVGVALLGAKNHAKAISGILQRFALGPASITTPPPSAQSKGTSAKPAQGQTLAATPSTSGSADAPKPPSNAQATTTRMPGELPPSQPPRPRADLAQPVVTKARVTVSRDVAASEAKTEEAGHDVVVEAENEASCHEFDIEAENEASCHEFDIEAEIDEAFQDTSIEAETEEPRDDASSEPSFEDFDPASLLDDEFEHDLDEDPTDRRTNSRVPYDQRVVALDEEAARVLVGRDLAPGGMRIAPSSEIQIGDVLRIALHSGTQTQPLIVLAEAVRDDGEEGLVLVFRGLTAHQDEQLEKIIASSSPIQATAGSDHTGGDSIVIGEMLETVERKGNLTEDDEIEAHLDSLFDTGQSIEDPR